MSAHPAEELSPALFYSQKKELKKKTEKKKNCISQKVVMEK